MESYAVDPSLVMYHLHKNLKTCLFHKIFKQAVMYSHYRISILLTLWIYFVGQYIYYYSILYKMKMYSTLIVTYSRVLDAATPNCTSNFFWKKFLSAFS